MRDLEIRQWDETAFLSNEKEWQTLLNSSDSNPLFLSWHWLKVWWSNYSDPSTDILSIFAVYQDDILVGLAPFYLTELFYIKGLIPVRRLQFIGKRYKGKAGILSEYMNLIAKSQMENLVSSIVVKYIFSSKTWDELIVGDISNNCVFHSTLINEANRRKLRSRLLGSDNCFSIDTTNTFENYLANLGKNTRLKLFNRRKVLDKHGDVSIECRTLKSSNDIFDQMNSFHKQRFNSPIFDKQSKSMIIEVDKVLSKDSNGKAYSSILKINKRPLSVIINLFVKGRIYNIQLGYIEHFDKKISLGTLHLGYAIEMAFTSDEISEFDLLAGGGKNSNYKEQIASIHTTLESVQIINKPLIKFIYIINDRIKSHSLFKAWKL
jgi:predicted N-acyltransferase